MAEYVADKGLEGSGPAKVINGIAPPGFRFALYALFGVIATAGVTIAVTEGKTTDALVNGGGLVLMLGLAFLDSKSQEGQVSSARMVMDNPELGKDVYNDENVAKIDNVGVNTGEYSVMGADDGSPKIQTAADLFGSLDDP
eukprot:CAMPEP_0171626202 /NCGR_PEP_ID=MMETSP0990-20121206/19875_1 /TAXON_ID=483369 /ORGANISM="non described non described, Strain CCMP2098" /LENGTH=140 /DNA_ID=CAMNT_0012193499 /DNA_START=205 /DNA_END=627 /DNA_ORIENTATION=-